MMLFSAVDPTTTHRTDKDTFVTLLEKTGLPHFNHSKLMVEGSTKQAKVASN